MSSVGKPWSVDDTSRLLRAWRKTVAGATPSPARVFARFEKLSENGRSGRSLAMITGRTNQMKNAFAVISTYNAREKCAAPSKLKWRSHRRGTGEDEKGEGETPWCRLSSTERRWVFKTTNKTTYGFMDLVPEHMTAIAAIQRNIEKARVTTAVVDTIEEATTKSEREDTAARVAAKRPREASEEDPEELKRPRWWDQDDSSRLLRAWELLLTRSGTAEIRSRDLVQCFEQLSDGGCSRLDFHTVTKKRIAFVHTHKFITEWITMNDGEEAQGTKHSGDVTDGNSKRAGDATHGGKWSKKRARAWFEMSIADRRNRFLTTHTYAYAYVELTRNQYDTLSRIKSAQPDAWNTVGKFIPTIAPEESSGSQIYEITKRVGWRHSDTTMLVRAWEAAAAKCAKPTSVQIIPEFHQLTNSDRSAIVLQRKLAAMSNMHDVIADHDSSIDPRRGHVCSHCGQAQRWFAISIVHRQRCFARSNKMVSKKYLELTEEQIFVIKRLMSGTTQWRMTQEHTFSAGWDRDAPVSSPDSESEVFDPGVSSSEGDEPSDDRPSSTERRGPRTPRDCVSQESVAAVCHHREHNNQVQIQTPSHQRSKTKATVGSPGAEVERALQIGSWHLENLLKRIRSVTPVLQVTAPPATATARSGALAASSADRNFDSATDNSADAVTRKHPHGQLRSMECGGIHLKHIYLRHESGKHT